MYKFSVIMPSYLGPYRGAASNREEKLVRAIDSVLAQSFTDWELIVVADGCDKTFEIVSNQYRKEENIDCCLIKKQVQWSGATRNYGISQAKGDYIVYLDADDIFGPNHLKIISESIGNYDWAYFNDYVKGVSENKERDCNIKIKFQHGTSNIVHKSSINAVWASTGYGYDDWGLVQHLLKLSKNYGKIVTPEYIVHHIPQLIDL